MTGQLRSLNGKVLRALEQSAADICSKQGLVDISSKRPVTDLLRDSFSLDLVVGLEPGLALAVCETSSASVAGCSSSRVSRHGRES